jgi:hypothetical protein
VGQRCLVGRAGEALLGKPGLCALGLCVHNKSKRAKCPSGGVEQVQVCIETLEQGVVGTVST